MKIADQVIIGDKIKFLNGDVVTVVKITKLGFSTYQFETAEGKQLMFGKSARVYLS